MWRLRFSGSCGGPSASRLAGAIGLALLGVTPGSAVGQELGRHPSKTCSGSEARVSGTVADRATGIPLPDAEVRVGFVPDSAAGYRWRAWHADEEGNFAGCVPASAVMVSAVASWGGRQGDTTGVVPGSDLMLRVPLGDPGFLRMSLVEAESGRPVEGAAIRLEPFDFLALSDSLGHASMRRVPPGSYELVVTHLAYRARTDTVLVRDGEELELHIPMSQRVVALEPLTVTVTGRDPRLVAVGFYDRRDGLREGYFALAEEIRPYGTIGTLLEFKRELFISFPDPALVLVNGRPARLAGYGNLDEIPLHRVRGVEAIRCGELPPEYLRYLDGSVDCSALLIWLR